MLVQETIAMAVSKDYGVPAIARPLLWRSTALQIRPGMPPSAASLFSVFYVSRVYNISGLYQGLPSLCSSLPLHSI